MGDLPPGCAPKLCRAFAVASQPEWVSVGPNGTATL